MKDELILQENIISEADISKEFCVIKSEINDYERKKIINEIMKTSGRLVIDGLNPNNLYKLVTSKELQKGKDGYYSGVIYDNNGIKQHAKFERINPNLVNSMRVAATRSLLLNICIQLNDIQESIQDILTELHDDRVSELHSKIDVFELSHSFNREERLKQISNIYQFIIEGVYKLLKEIERDSSNLKEIKNNGIMSNVFKTSTKKAGEIIPRIQESTILVYRGIDVAIKILISLGQPEEAIISFLDNCINKLNKIDFELVREKSRFVKVQEGKYIENTFTELIVLKEEIEKRHHENKKKIQNDLIAIEFRPSEYEEDGYVNL